MAAIALRNAMVVVTDTAVTSGKHDQWKVHGINGEGDVGAAHELSDQA